jgi:hypothetical protein
MSLLESPRQWGALGLSLVTSSVIFARRVLVLKKFTWPLKVYHYATYVISITSGVVFWATLNALRHTIAIQLVLGVTSTVLAWVVFVLLVNESLQYPSRQQWVSLAFHIITEATLLFQVRLVLTDGDEKDLLTNKTQTT